MKELTNEEIYETGRRIGKAEGHNNPSPETRERLAKLETNQSNFMEQNTKEHKEITDALIRIDQKIDDALKGKANKWVETTFSWFLYFAATGVLAIIGTIIYKAIIYFSEL